MRSTEESRKGSRFQLYWLELVLFSFISSCPRILPWLQRTVRSLGDKGSMVAVSGDSTNASWQFCCPHTSTLNWMAILYHISEIVGNVLTSGTLKDLSTREQVFTRFFYAEDFRKFKEFSPYSCKSVLNANKDRTVIYSDRLYVLSLLFSQVLSLMKAINITSPEC